MEGVNGGTIGTYRSTVDSLPDPPPYPGNEETLNHFEVKIAPDQINGETSANGMAATDDDDRLAATLHNHSVF